MTRPLAVSLAVLLASPLAACATPRGGDGQPAPNAAPASAAEEPKWEPWPPPAAMRERAEKAAAAENAPPGPTVRLAAKDGGWRIDELLAEVTRVTGRPILFDGTNATFKQAKVEFIAGKDGLEMPSSEFFPFVQAALSYRKLVLVPVGPKLANGEQAWFVMDQADPNLKSRPVFLDENEVLDYADRDGLYVVTTLRLRDTVDATRARNALSPLSTATAGIGRIMDMGMGGRSLIVGDFAPVVAAMKRLLDRINAETLPSAVRPAPAPAAPAAPKAEK
jgi:hypothetical protein